MRISQRMMTAVVALIGFALIVVGLRLLTQARYHDSPSRAAIQRALEKVPAVKSETAEATLASPPPGEAGNQIGAGTSLNTRNDAQASSRSVAEPDSAHGSVDGRARNPQPEIGIELDSRTAVQMHETIYRDCLGQELSDCRRLLITFEKILGAPEEGADGWSDWMEAQIGRSLSDRASENRFAQTGVKCSEYGCVFFVAANSPGEMFVSGYRHHSDFHKWLLQQSWNEWLEIHSNRRGEHSTLAWKVVGLHARPFFNWYVVTPKVTGAEDPAI